MVRTEKSGVTVMLVSKHITVWDVNAREIIQVVLSNYEWKRKDPYGTFIIMEAR